MTPEVSRDEVMEIVGCPEPLARCITCALPGDGLNIGVPLPDTELPAQYDIMRRLEREGVVRIRRQRVGQMIQWRLERTGRKAFLVAVPAHPNRRCAGCGTPLPACVGSDRKFCTPRCQKNTHGRLAYVRKREKAGAANGNYHATR